MRQDRSTTMTFRAKPVVKRARRPSWETQDRRSLYLNIGFGLIVILAVVILAVAAGLTYYNDHLASVGSVDGQSISKDEFSDRLQVDSWRLDEEIRRTRVRGVCRPHQPDAGRRSGADTRAVEVAAAGGQPRAVDRLDAAGQAGRRGGRDRHAAGHRCSPDRRGDHPGTAPRVGHRGRPHHRHWSHRAVRRTEGRRQGHGRAGPQGHPGRQGLGGRRQDGLDRYGDRATGRRPRLDPGR